MNVKIQNDLELIMHLDFEHETPCDVESCDKAAEWKFTLSCCGLMKLYCDRHFCIVKKWKDTQGLIHPEKFGGCGGRNIEMLNVERFKVSA